MLNIKPREHNHEIVRNHVHVQYNTLKIKDTDIFYREAGNKDKPTILLLHGFPTSSHMYRELIAQLAHDYHVIAPDYPGFGNSGTPERDAFDYSFDNFAMIINDLLSTLKIDAFSMYVFDYGAPIGFRIYHDNPKRVQSIIVQNGNAYDEGIADFWTPIKAYWETHDSAEREAIRWLTSIKATRWQYENGTPQSHLNRISPDAWQHTQAMLDRPGNAEIQLDIFYDYQSNPPLYDTWQTDFRTHQTPMLVIWGKNDEIFVAPGGEAYKRDLPNAEIHMLDAGHFALETHAEEIGSLMLEFLSKHVQ